MAKLNGGILEKVFKFLEGIKVFTLDQLVSSLNCSAPTGRLRLKRWEAYTSYNQNGRYYALPVVPRFDEDGLWHYESTSFSKYGTLRKTIVHLISTSPSGLTGNEIGNLVRLPPRSFLHHFRNVAGIYREKKEGVYVYFSEDQGRYKEQVWNRESSLFSGKPISDADAVVILTALIKYHGISVSDIMTLPEIQERRFSPIAIRDFLDRHGLLKKTPITRP